MSAHIVVAGAGAIGSTIAYRLARAGYAVRVVDPAAPGDNASGVAAGMLAPAFESLFDDAAAGRFRPFAAARDRWPALAAEIGLVLDQAGALAVGTRAQADDWRRALIAAGAAASLRTADEVAGLGLGLPAGVWGAFTPDDWRLDPRAALARLRSGAEQHGARFLRGQVTGFVRGEAQLEGAPPLRADRLVIATGAAMNLAEIAPELAALTPIKGHILRAVAAFAPGPVTRLPSAYLCRSAGEAILGATMEPGVADTAVDPAVAAALKAQAAPLIARQRPVAWRAAAGVRASTADGLPMVGPGQTEDVILAVGARRNGWLLAPLIAQVVLDAVAGRPARGPAALFAPARFKIPG